MYKIIIPINIGTWYELYTKNENLAKGINDYWEFQDYDKIKFIKNNFENLYKKIVVNVILDMENTDITSLKNRILPELVLVALSDLNVPMLYSSIFSRIFISKITEIENKIKDYVDKL